MFGAVAVYSGGTLALDESPGSTFTVGSLNLQSGSSVTENVQYGQLELTSVTGQLRIDSTTTMSFPNYAGQGFAPFQELFAYGSLYDGSFSHLSLSAPGGATLFQDTIAKTIDLTQGTVLYWADGSENWDPSYNAQWENAATQQTQAWTAGAVAVFPGAGTYNIPVDFAATPLAMIFADGTYTIGVSGTGTISMPGNALVSVGSGTATISAPLSADGTTHTAIVDLQAGTLVLNGNDGGVGNVTVLSNAAGTLQLGDGSASNTLPAAAFGDSIAFDKSRLDLGCLLGLPTALQRHPRIAAGLCGTISGNFAVIVNGGQRCDRVHRLQHLSRRDDHRRRAATLVVTSASCFGASSADRSRSTTERSRPWG